jgi:hypothetical protein
VSQPTSPLSFDNVQGQWWLPAERGVRRSGSLTVTGGGVRVHLHGRLGDQDLPGSLGPTPVLPVVHGHLESGKDVTLRRALVVNDTQTIFGAGDDHSELSASEVLIGTHLDDPPAATFNAFSLTFPGLMQWSAISGVTGSIENDGEKLRRTYSYARPDDRICVLEDGGRVLLRSCSTVGAGDGDTRVAISEWGILIVEPAQPINMSAFKQDYAMPLTRLLTFAHDQQVEATQLAARAGPDGGAPWIEVVTGRERAREVRRRAGQDYVVSGSDDDSFQDLLQRWIILHERFRIPLDVHFAHAYEDGVFLERQLTESVQTLEGLDRIANPVPDRAINAHGHDLVRITELLAGEPNQIRKLVVGRLKYAYEPNLADRLRRQFREEQSAIPMVNKARNKAADRIATTRNLLTHLDSERERPTIQQMYDASSSVTTLAKLMILRELGFPPEERQRIRVNRAWHLPGESVDLIQ